MLSQRYVVSVCWGSGKHCFEAFFDTKDEALRYVEGWSKQSPPAFPPTLHIWYLIDSFKKD